MKKGTNRNATYRTWTTRRMSPDRVPQRTTVGPDDSPNEPRSRPTCHHAWLLSSGSTNLWDVAVMADTRAFDLTVAPLHHLDCMKLGIAGRNAS